MNKEKIKIGIDLDNTIICYDVAFQLAAKKFGLFLNGDGYSKKNLRDCIRQKKGGEVQWQRLQSHVYGEGIDNAHVFTGFHRFLWRCNQSGIEVEIVSHKTEYGHFDEDKISLREKANTFLSNNLIDNNFLIVDKITYTNTKDEKLDYIKSNNFDFFIDDLIEIIEELTLISDYQSILFSSKISKNVKSIESWPKIENHFFDDLKLSEVELLVKMIVKNGVGEVIQLNGRGNSSVYKITTTGAPIFFKIYPQESGHNRINSEFDSTSMLFSSGMTEIQNPIACNKALGIAAYKWIDVDDSYEYNTSTVRELLNFLKKLHDCKVKRKFDTFLMASDSCTSISEIEMQIKRRLSELDKASEHSAMLNNFLENEFKPLFKKVAIWSKAGFSNDDYYKPIERQEMTLNPSDFGFHNILMSQDGCLKFIDFEYFGWDDPVKLASDFSHHAAMNLTKEMECLWFQGIKNIYGECLLDRLKASWPLYGLNWCLIILNEFNNDIWNKRCLANKEIKHNRGDILLRQLTKSRGKLVKIAECYRDKNFW